MNHSSPNQKKVLSEFTTAVRYRVEATDPVCRSVPGLLHRMAVRYGPKRSGKSTPWLSTLTAFFRVEARVSCRGTSLGCPVKPPMVAQDRGVACLSPAGDLHQAGIAHDIAVCALSPKNLLLSGRKKRERRDCIAHRCLRSIKT